MADLSPFPGVRYSLSQPESASDVVAPPYDVIDADEHLRLLDRHPHNAIRLELPVATPEDDEHENRYTRAAALYRDWLRAGVLAREAEPVLYVYGQRYLVDGQPRERLGLIGALGVEPYERQVVLPHEQTFPKHKEDRYRLLTTAGAQFSPIFGLYSAPGEGVRAALEAVAVAEPVASAVDPEGVEHRLWVAPDPKFAAWARALFAGRQTFIADGHHRYETALRLRTERRGPDPGPPSQPVDSVMTFLVEMDDPGLVLLPTHRILGQVRPDLDWLIEAGRLFDLQPVPAARLNTMERGTVGILTSTGAWIATLRHAELMDRVAPNRSAAWRSLEVSVLHSLLIPLAVGNQKPTIRYTRDPREAHSAVSGSDASAVFFLPAPSVEDLKAIAGGGERMPEKSTYFWPKAITGLVIYSHD